MKLIRPGDVCIDMGANIGALALSLSHRVGPSGTVVAFEPGPVLIHRLCKNVKLSRRRNVQCVNLGLSSRAGDLFWKFEVGDNYGNASMGKHSGDCAVRVIKMDDCSEVEKLPRVDFIKIDVEGMEHQVIIEASKRIDRFKPNILFETHAPPENQMESRNVTESLKLLENAGYRFWEIDVPEAQPKSFEPKLNFIKTAYPSPPQNTLVVHVTKEKHLSFEPKSMGSGLGTL